jgi:hypothetical protein
MELRGLQPQESRQGFQQQASLSLEALKHWLRACYRNVRKNLHRSYPRNQQF